MKPQDQIGFIPQEEIDAALKDEGVSQYLTGNLKRPQALKAIPDDDVEAAISETFAEPETGLKHFHPIVTEYQYVLEGSIDVLEIASGVKHHFKKGDFFIIYPHTEYQTTIAPRSKILFFKYPGMNDKTLL